MKLIKQFAFDSSTYVPRIPMLLTIIKQTRQFPLVCFDFNVRFVHIRLDVEGTGGVMYINKPNTVTQDINSFIIKCVQRNHQEAAL